MNHKLKNILFFSISGILLIFLMSVIWIFTPNREDKICENVIVRVVDEDKYKFADEQDVRREMKNLGIELKGKALKDISLDRVEKQLERHVMLRKVACYQNSKGDIIIDVEQKVPMFRVITNSSSYYVDSERKKMPVSLNHVAYVPLVSGSVDTNFATLELYDFIVFLQNDNFLSSLIEQIYVYPNNDVELIPRVGSFRIFLGSLERYDAKTKKLKVFYKKVLPKVGWDKYSKINLEFKDQVVAE